MFGKKKYKSKMNRYKKDKLVRASMMADDDLKEALYPKKKKKMKYSLW